MTDPDARREWERHRFGRDPETDDLLNRHLGRTGGNQSASVDPAANLQVAVLRDFLRVLHSALDDEHIDPAVSRRVIERVIYGGVPQPATAAERVDERKRWAERLSLGPVARYFMEGDKP